jgi:cell division septal protein FtsQ
MDVAPPDPVFRMPRASRRVLWWAAAVMAVLVAWMAAPLALRRVAFFRVRQVELVGIRHLDADRVLAALRMSPRASVFDDTEPLAERLRRVEGIADASVIRRPPASLKVIVREVEPVALVANPRGALGVVDAEGRPLPFELLTLDLPVVQAADSGVVGVLARVQAFDPQLYQAIDAARRADAHRGDVLLELGRHRVLLSPNAGPEVIQAVMLVARDLAAKGRPYEELDGRYAGQVIVRRRARGGSA